jgi:D-3-phosphoglycerate dehydrogenase
MKIVVAEKIAPAAVALLRQEREWNVVTPEEIGNKLSEHLADADALIVRSAVDVNERLLEQAHQLRVIGRAGVGVDNVDLHAATRKGIAVMNTPGANAVAVAEHTLGLMLTMARQLTRADRTMHAGKWEKKSLQGTELRGKTLGVIGLGRIGQEVTRRALAFGMTVLAHDPYLSADVAEEMGARLVTVEELLPLADYITLHLGLTPQTIGLVNTDFLAKMKKGARLLNCARGELVEEAALVEALKSGHLAGAALDVFQEEPLKDSPLFALDSAILTPHIGGSTKEAQDAVGVQIAQQVKEYLTKGVFQNAVNVPSVSYEEYVEMQPFIVLAERLGSFVAQITDGNVKEIALRYGGRLSGWKTELVRNAAVMGVVNRVLAEPANVVNAAATAEARGVRITESGKSRKDKEAGSADVLTITLHTPAGQREVRGTVLRNTSPRLIAIDDIDIETRLEQNLIYLRNLDVPGVIGQVGSILSKHGVNIANFSLGRREEDATPRLAVAVVRVDGPTPSAAIAELRHIEAVQAARAIILPNAGMEKLVAEAEAETE